MARAFSSLAPPAITTVAGTPSERLSPATAMPWLPEEPVTIPPTPAAVANAAADAGDTAAQHRVRGPAQLERPGVLQVFGLQQEAGQ